MKNLPLLLLLPIITACSNPALMIANGLAKFGDYTLKSNIAYGKNARQTLDIYLPNGQSKGILMFFYGGCWGACTGYDRTHYRFVAQTFVTQGYTVVIPDYRLYPQVLFPEIMSDSAQAVHWVNQHIQEYDADPNQLFLMGHSAGAHIAAMLTVNEQYLGKKLHANIQGYIGLAGAYDFIFDKPYMPTLFINMPYAETQPSHFIDGTEPPLLLLYGKNDTTIYPRNIINMEKAVLNKQGMVETHLYEGVDHVDILAALSIPYRQRYSITQDILRFLDNQYIISRNSLFE